MEMAKMNDKNIAFLGHLCAIRVQDLDLSLSSFEYKRKLAGTIV